MITIETPQGTVVEFLFEHITRKHGRYTAEFSSRRNAEGIFTDTPPICKYTTTVHCKVTRLNGFTNEYTAKVSLSEGDRPDRVVARSYAILKVLGVATEYADEEQYLLYEPKAAGIPLSAMLSVIELTHVLDQLVNRQRMRFKLDTPQRTGGFVERLNNTYCGVREG